MDYRRLELKLRRIVEKRLKEGWEVQASRCRGVINQHNVCCCLVGAIGIDAGKRHWVSNRDAAARVGISIDALLSVEKGFDGGRSFAFIEDASAFSIGARIRRIYCDDNRQVE